LPVTDTGAQRASSQRSVRLTVLSLAFALVAAIGMANPLPTAAAGLKVVIVVGPVGSSTANYIYNAKKYAAQARSYGANVVEIYSPNATWARVKAAAQGAKVAVAARRLERLEGLAAEIGGQGTRRIPSAR